MKSAFGFSIYFIYTFLFLTVTSFAGAANYTPGTGTPDAVLQTVRLVSSIVTGGVTPSSARFWGRLSGSGSFSIQVSKNENFSNPLTGSTVSVDSISNFSGIVNVTGLEANTKYFYRAVINSVPSDSTKRYFLTFPETGSTNNFTFAFGSCQQSGSLLPSGSPAGKIFKEVIKVNPRFFLQLGDWGYPDTTDNVPFDNNFYSAYYDKVQKTYAARFDSSYLIDTVFRTLPFDYVFDDHDFMNDNASALSASFTIPFKPNPLGNDFVAMNITAPPGCRENSIRGYKENMPGYPLVNESRGIYHKFSFGNVDIFALDLRSQRTGNMDAVRKNNITNKWEFSPPAGHTILGRENSPGSGNSQLSWFIDELRNSTARWKFIMSSVPFNKGQSQAISLGVILQEIVLNAPPGLLPPGTTGIFAVHEFADKWVGFPSDQDSILRTIQRENLKNIIVISGDSHTAAIDDGTNAGIPEIMAGGLDIANSQMAALFSTFGINIWNKGGQGLTTTDFLNAYGKVSVYGSDSVNLALMDENGVKFASHTVINEMIIPVEMISFNATAYDDKCILNWVTATELNNERFDIEKSGDNISWEKIGSIKGSGTTSSNSTYSFTDNSFNSRAFYRLRQFNFDGTWDYSAIVEASNATIRDFLLGQNYPNPFNPSTNIDYFVPSETDVILKVFDVLGNEITTLVSQKLQAGKHSVNFTTSGLPAGVYIYEMRAGSFSARKKLVLVK